MLNYDKGTAVKAHTSTYYENGRYEISFSEDAREIYILQTNDLKLTVFSSLRALEDVNLTTSRFK